MRKIKKLVATLLAVYVPAANAVESFSAANAAFGRTAYNNRANFFVF